MYATAKSSHGQSAPGSLEQANALEAMCEALNALVGDLRGQIETLTSRVDDLETAARDTGAGENTIDYGALEEDQLARSNDEWTAEDEAAYQAELPRTLPHQP